MHRRLLWALAALFSLSATVATAAPHHGHHGKHRAVRERVKDTPATKAYKEAMHRMHQGMDIRYTGDPDTDFARGMIPHHRGAVDMARVVLRYGSDPDIRTFAEWVSTVQPQEIAEMRQWLLTKGRNDILPDAEQQPATLALRAANDHMHEGMNIAYGKDADVDFACGMIPHHQGAVDMAEALLVRGRTPEMQQLAEDIRSSQRAEILFLQRWLARKTGKETCR